MPLADIPMPPALSVVRQHPAWSDLYQRERARPVFSPARLRNMVASRWWRTHPVAYVALQYAREAEPLRAQFMCIAGHESGHTWAISTGNGYYGGLQMDRTFQRGYGPELYATKGTADNWTVDEQIAVASRAVPDRGFTPWPNTARMCGLL